MPRFLVLLLWISTAAASDVVPGARQSGPVAVVGGTVHTVSGKTIEGGTVLFESGRITAVGRRVKLPEGTTTVEASGRHVYPGLIEPFSNIGLVEINAVRATRDQSEVGTFNPNVKSWVAVNPDSELIPVTRTNGVLLAVSAPSGGMISGQSALLQLDGWTYEDLVVKAPLGMHVNWPRMQVVRGGLSGEDVKKQTQNRDDRLRRLNDFFDDARAYLGAKEADPDRPASCDSSSWCRLATTTESMLPRIMSSSAPDPPAARTFSSGIPHLVVT